MEDVNHVRKNSFDLWFYKYSGELYHEFCQESFKILGGPLNCNSKKVLYLLKFKICGAAPYYAKTDVQLLYRFNNYKSKHRTFRKSNQKVPWKHFHTDHALMTAGKLMMSNKQWETHVELKERVTFWQHRPKWKRRVPILIEQDSLSQP